MPLKTPCSAKSFRTRRFMKACTSCKGASSSTVHSSMSSRASCRKHNYYKHYINCKQFLRTFLGSYSSSDNSLSLSELSEEETRSSNSSLNIISSSLKGFDAASAMRTALRLVFCFFFGGPECAPSGWAVTVFMGNLIGAYVIKGRI